MRARLPRLLVTGGAGFIGSAFVRMVLGGGRHPAISEWRVPRFLRGLSLTIVDKLTYAADLKRLEEVKGKFTFIKADICDARRISDIFQAARPDFVINFAAETHVDRSINDASSFFKTNVCGAQVLLDCARKYAVKKFIHISTDEVYGDITKGSFREDSPLRPSSPYSASKAAADLLVSSYIRTHALPAIIIRPSNNYGPWQYPEKFIPRSVLKILQGGKIPLYADGKNVREWLYVDDCVRGILRIMDKGKIAETYNLGSREQRQNIELAKLILAELGAPKGAIKFVKDRPGHDLRYSLDSGKLYNSLGFEPKTGLKDGIKATLDWALKNKKWLFAKSKDVAKLYRSWGK